MLHLGKVIKIENSPSDDDEQQTVYMQQEGRYLILHLQQGIFFDNHDDTEIKTPDDEVPAGSVPHTGQEPDNKDVERLVTSVSSHWNIDIVAEETT